MFCLFFFFFNDTATTEIYTLSLHDALPIFADRHAGAGAQHEPCEDGQNGHSAHQSTEQRSEEHTSELQSPCNLVCRLLLEKKKKKIIILTTIIHITPIAAVEQTLITDHDIH